jgi:hypothetical protein
MKHLYNQELNVGDTFVHATKQSTSVHLKYGIITDVQENKLCVTMLVYKLWGEGEYTFRTYRTYRTTLNTTRNLLKATIPDDMRKLLDLAL